MQAGSRVETMNDTIMLVVVDGLTISSRRGSEPPGVREW
jgi:hypothetical protein